MAKTKSKTKFICQDCGYESAKWLGKCPGCSQWNSFAEEVVPTTSERIPSNQHPQGKPESIAAIDTGQEPRTSTGYQEFDRVLGGGIVSGSLVLVGGDPGIGKSTLLLQTSFSVAKQGKKVLYVTGEESSKQIKLRADRLQTIADELFILPATDLEFIETQIRHLQPDFVMIDSIQTMYLPHISSAPGSVSQVRECTGYLLRISKSLQMAIFIVGHVTKEGTIAGPRLLEHMVDAVLYFEGERHHSYRILRAVKNRFGSTNEMGIFEMRELGLSEVRNPSELFLAERPQGVAGSAVVASMEGTRPLLVEIQALLTPTAYGNPRRMAAGVENSRVALLMAVLEKRVGLFLQNQDAYVNVAGGVRLDEPAVDLGIAVSIGSSFRNQSIHPYDVFIGEIGLTGEIRAVSRIEQRVKEALKLGFHRCFLPIGNMRGWKPPEGIQIIAVETLQDAFHFALEG
ncbi:DNA repair protein RadA [Fodinisporobacter ferrooxydans]|uniref:DNA repair protein RadA n=1 Tax=Fodinisporobacter ferrooxydans TaxID=2901836 RepID=A0ABY4CRL0_9BACL|nr:DNA repair protein RadA [Alicyclobacillaceae bacterium MYW30-H2]